ncbi:hypothetical protein SAMN04487910_2460 [Aquimarina amphilecti]|uniref:Uncharacterized protein n=1 Tax=Aquimarina amphilecti TaxID=1038014 RepID=A0A1H7Q8E5_AQUAM|nr:hypothetical protein [Aquimarina amphilecti]SEL43988.1 hypothetical protein SAMN04487910_2460 [Aquimarina amphilecti]
MRHLFSIFLLILFSCNNATDTSTNTIPKNEVSKIHKDTTLKRKLELIGIEDQTLRLILPDITKKFDVL